MLAPDTLLGEFPGEQAHIKRQQDALFSRHRPQNFKLDSLRRRTGIGVGHEENVTTRCSCDPTRVLEEARSGNSEDEASDMRQVRHPTGLYLRYRAGVNQLA